MRWRSLVDHVSEILLPRGCAACDSPLQVTDEHWCSHCTWTILRAVDRDYCTRCGLPTGPYLLHPEGCTACRQKKLGYEAMARVGRYDGPIGELIRKYKYQSRQRLDYPLGMLLVSSIAGHLPVDTIDVIVPVPTTRSSLLKYRFSPVRQLAAVVSRELGIPLVNALHIKGKQRRQTELPESQRQANVRGVFHLVPGTDLSGTTVCMIDDVCTSGATFHEVAKMLKKGGAKRVFAACIAKAVPSAWQTPAEVLPSRGESRPPTRSSQLV